ncbi:YopX family protein [Paenibacillus senegalimassiliensis]|uniref:YopX family protein n=1 Tax=Paenibacillus senegalimassiliensis TaxID=1737426 RepID=UPI00073EA75F|nr:YopX family protein [Paenibacillus senegalimassiliensis]
MDMKLRAFYKPLKLMLQPEQIESINFDTKVLGVYMEMDGKGYHQLRMSDFDIMWFAGFQDVHGKDVFQGDIREFEDMGEEGHEYKEGYDFTNRAVVMIEEGRFAFGSFMDSNSGVLEEINLHDETYSAMQHSRVIGNIYENPELLEDKRYEI